MPMRGFLFLNVAFDADKVSLSGDVWKFFFRFLLFLFFSNQNFKYIISELRDGKLFWELHCLVTFSYKGACRVRDRTFLGNGSLNGKGLGPADVRLQWVGG